MNQRLARGRDVAEGLAVADEVVAYLAGPVGQFVREFVVARCQRPGQNQVLRAVVVNLWHFGGPFARKQNGVLALHH